MHCLFFIVVVYIPWHNVYLTCNSITPASQTPTLTYEHQNFMAKLNSLPTFTYSKTYGCRTRSGRQLITISEATCRYRNQTIIPRFTFSNIIDKRKWKKSKPPPKWPKHLKWPNDIFKALLYDLATPVPDKKGKQSAKRVEQIEPRLFGGYPPCFAHDCPNPQSEITDPDSLCNCDNAPWASRRNMEWFESNFELTSQGARGIGVISRATFPRGEVLGEYVGEVLPSDPLAPNTLLSNYLFDIFSNDGGIALIDGLRVRSWTRFINHSCRPNTEFIWKRVGKEIMVCVEVIRHISVGKELTVGYGSAYWEGMAKKGQYCGCGEKRCKFSGGTATGGSM
jgi:hypothetical protein